MQRFAGKVCLVTGGRGGIGRAIVQHLRDERARVISVQRSADTAGESMTADLTDPQVPEGVVAQVVDRSGRLDVLINCAGIMQGAGIESLSVDDWQRSLMVNLTAPFLFIRASLPHLRQCAGTIVNIGSIEGLAANAGHAAYCASKAGLHGLTRAVAVDHGADGIRCYAVAPGWIDTDLNQDLIESMPDSARFRHSIGAIHLLGRTGRPEEVAALVAFLAAEESGFITGQVYTIDGGRMIRLSLPD